MGFHSVRKIEIERLTTYRPKGLIEAGGLQKPLDGASNRSPSQLHCDKLRSLAAFLLIIRSDITMKSWFASDSLTFFSYLSKKSINLV